MAKEEHVSDSEIKELIDAGEVKEDTFSDSVDFIDRLTGRLMSGFGDFWRKNW